MSADRTDTERTGTRKERVREREEPFGTGRARREPSSVAPVPRSSSDGRSVPELVRELSHEGADLVRQEVALAKAEMNEKIDTFQRSMISIAVGGAFLIAALLYGLWAVNSGVTLVLAQFMAPEMAIWLAPLILGAVLALIGWGMIQASKESIKREGLTPQTTKETLRDDTRWARSKASEVKREMKHG